MRTIYNHTSLRKHKVTEKEVDDVYATGVDFDLSPSIKGNDRIMLVGLTSNGKQNQARFQQFLRQ